MISLPTARDVATGAPRAATAWRPYGTAVDVWAVGVLLFEALSGWPPFRHRSPELLALLVQAGAPPPLPAGASAEAAAFVAAAMATAPAARPSAAQLLAHPWVARHCGGSGGSGAVAPAPASRGAWQTHGPVAWPGVCGRQMATSECSSAAAAAAAVAAPPCSAFSAPLPYLPEAPGAPAALPRRRSPHAPPAPAPRPAGDRQPPLPTAVSAPLARAEGRRAPRRSDRSIGRPPALAAPAGAAAALAGEAVGDGEGDVFFLDSRPSTAHAATHAAALGLWPPAVCPASPHAPPPPALAAQLLAASPPPADARLRRPSLPLLQSHGQAAWPGLGSPRGEPRGGAGAAAPLLFCATLDAEGHAPAARRGAAAAAAGPFAAGSLHGGFHGEAPDLGRLSMLVAACLSPRSTQTGTPSAAGTPACVSRRESRHEREPRGCCACGARAAGCCCCGAAPGGAGEAATPESGLRQSREPSSDLGVDVSDSAASWVPPKGGRCSAGAKHAPHPADDDAPPPPPPAPEPRPPPPLPPALAGAHAQPHAAPQPQACRGVCGLLVVSEGLGGAEGRDTPAPGAKEAACAPAPAAAARPPPATPPAPRQPPRLPALLAGCFSRPRASH